MTSSFKGLTINDTGNLTLPNGTSANRPSLYSSTAIQWTNTGSQAYSVITGSGGTVSNTSWTCPTGVTSIEVLVVAGGGQGGSTHGGGGGGGGVIYNSAFPVTPGTAYTVTVGAGGYLAQSSPSQNGSNSVFGSLTAIGGGAGTSEAGTGLSGGSGGGGGGKGGAVYNGGAGTIGQGFPGGRGTDNSPYNGGGGGGAGGPGQPATTAGGTGGPGVQYSISGTPTYYAGGGGGNCYGPTSGTLIGFGGVGGGGNGGIYQTGSTTLGTAGTASTGGGGGGNYLSTQQYGMAGGSGIVIIRFTLATATTMATGQTRFNTTAGAMEDFGTTQWSPQSTGDNIVTNGLLVHLDASKYSSGSTWYDLTGNGNNGTLNNGVAFSTNYISTELFTTNAGSLQDGANTTGLVIGYGSATVGSVTTENSIAPYSGANQLRLSGTNNGERVDYAFNVTAGKTYEVTFYARQYQGSIYFISYVATTNSGDNLGSAIGSGGGMAVNASSWTLYTTIFTATTTGVHYLCWRMGSGSSPANITYVDKVSIKEVVNTAGAPALIMSGGNALIDLNTSSYALGIRRQATYAAWAMTLGAGSFNIPSDYEVTGSGGMTVRFSPGVMTFYVYPNNSRINITYPVIQGQWYHIVAVMDNYMIYLYVNGQLIGSQTLANAIGASGASTLKIGPRGDGDVSAGGAGGFAGAIGSLQIYGRTLSPEEVRLNYNAQASRYGQTPLVDYDDNKWKTVNLSEAKRPNLWAFTSGYGNQSISGGSGYLYMGNTSSGNNAANWQAVILDNNVLGSISYAPGWRSWESTFRLGYSWGWSTWSIRTAATTTGLAGNGLTSTSGSTPTTQGGAYFSVMNNSSNNTLFPYTTLFRSRKSVV